MAAATSSSVVRSTTNPGFVNGLREHGYVEGWDIDVGYKFADGFFDRANLTPAVGHKSGEPLVACGPNGRPFTVR